MAPKRSKLLSGRSDKRIRSDKFANVNFNEIYREKELKSKLNTCFVTSSSQEFGSNGIKINSYPFTNTIIPNFIPDEAFLTALEKELRDLKLHEKNNDLYKFHQSSDLSNEMSPAIRSFRQILSQEFSIWLKDVTGIPLSDNEIFMTCSRYEYSDVLLCHDDKLEGRRIAFIFYLVPDDWNEIDGGLLDLFDVDEYGQPNKIVNSLVPTRNNFIFFEVNPVSFHQVSEVLSNDKVRLTIGGWFHGQSVKRQPSYAEPSPHLTIPGFIEERKLYEWINPAYIDMKTQKEIRRKFQEDSEIELEGFLAEEKYREVCEALKDSEIPWNVIGPPNKRRYGITKKTELPNVVDEFVRLMESEAMFLILSSLTGLRLHKMAEVSDDSDADDDVGNASCHTEIRKWNHTCYTLLRDNDVCKTRCLSSVMFFNCEEWLIEMGGYVSHIAKGEDEELLTICPRKNCLALVYKDEETISFVKYINGRINSKYFYDISVIYYE